MKTGITALVVIGILALCFFQWRGCQSQKAAEAKAEAAVIAAQGWKARGDSADARANHALVAWGKDTVRWAKKADSLTRRFAKSDTAVNREKAVIGALVAVGDAAKERKDTGAQLSSCDSLRARLKIANVAVTDLQTSSETIQVAFTNEIQQRDSTINLLAGSVLQLRTAKDSLAAIAIDQAKQNVKLSIPRHWAVGPSGGVTYINGKLQPIIGATVTYTIFRF
jgi:hypothetical protein